jgi:hypothetical protein
MSIGVNPSLCSHSSLAGDSVMVIRANELLVGVLDKNALGPSPFGLVHSVYEAYGPNAAGALLSAVGRLLTVYLQVCNAEFESRVLSS